MNESSKVEHTISLTKLKMMDGILQTTAVQKLGTLLFFDHEIPTTTAPSRPLRLDAPFGYRWFPSTDWAGEKPSSLAHDL
jgi:hypothetical protein